MSSRPLETWEIDLLNKHLRDCAVPVIYEPDGSVSVGSGELAAEKLRAMERHALWRLPRVPSFPPGFFRSGFTSRLPQLAPVLIPMRPGFQPDSTPEPPTLTAAWKSAVSLRRGRRSC